MRNHSILGENGPDTELMTFGHDRIAFVVAVAFAVSLARVCLAADANPVVFPPLQIFKELIEVTLITRAPDEKHAALAVTKEIAMTKGATRN
jgi:hypothetical protein